jgi:hypothetical protein
MPAAPAGVPARPVTMRSVPSLAPRSRLPEGARAPEAHDRKISLRAWCVATPPAGRRRDHRGQWITTRRRSRAAASTRSTCW